MNSDILHPLGCSSHGNECQFTKVLLNIYTPYEFKLPSTSKVYSYGSELVVSLQKVSTY